jgi:predicted  nucleic acid-binding Zn-ribbon protein
MINLRENYILFLLTAILSAFTSTGASAYQLGGFKQEFRTTQRQIIAIESRLDALTTIVVEGREDRKLLRQEISFMKETLQDIKKGVYALHND